MSPTPFYEDGQVTIYHGDCCWDVGAWLDADVLITDPPYGIDFRSGWTDATIANDVDTTARDAVLQAWGAKPGLVFGAAGEAKLPGAVTSLVWWRPGSGMGDLALPWKPDFELIHVFGEGFASTSRGPGVLRYPWDVFRGDAGHPHRKPVGLLRDLIAKCPPEWVIADPFMGSGTTLRAAKDLGRRAIGVEIEQQYCDLAASRMAQDVLDFGGAA